MKLAFQNAWSSVGVGLVRRLAHKSDFCLPVVWWSDTKALGFISAIGMEKLIGWMPLQKFQGASIATSSVSNHSQGVTWRKMQLVYMAKKT